MSSISEEHRSRVTHLLEKHLYPELLYMTKGTIWNIVIYVVYVLYFVVQCTCSVQCNLFCVCIYTNALYACITDNFLQSRFNTFNILFCFSKWSLSQSRSRISQTLVRKILYVMQETDELYVESRAYTQRGFYEAQRSSKSHNNV